MSTKANNTLPSVWAGKTVNGKRGLRLLPKEGGFFAHVTSRAVHQRFLLENTEKDAFVGLMTRWADFSGLTVLTHCVMGNHFHILVWVPPVKEVESISNTELMRRLQQVWPERKFSAWKRAFEVAPDSIRAEMRGELTHRMHDLPAFMRVLKQSFTVWYNAGHKVSGTFWEGRYRCQVVEDSPEILFRVASYIDLNPLRAGILRDPTRYAWSGIGSSRGANPAAREGLRQLVFFGGLRLPREIKGSQEITESLRASFPGQSPPWDMAREVYRVWIFMLGRDLSDGSNVPSNRRERPGFSEGEVSRVLNESLASLVKTFW